jgi:HTH-type transcriptional regulator/antitoxin HipB
VVPVIFLKKLTGTDDIWEVRVQVGNDIFRLLGLFVEENKMSDLQIYINNRKAVDLEFAEGFDEGYQAFKFGVLLKEAHKEAGLTQLDVADKLQTQKSAISRIENHSEDVKLSTLERFAAALGKKLEINLV